MGLLVVPFYSLAWPLGYKTFFVLISAEQEIFLLINMKMPTIVGMFILLLVFSIY